MKQGDQILWNSNIGIPALIVKLDKDNALVTHGTGPAYYTKTIPVNHIFAGIIKVGETVSYSQPVINKGVVLDTLVNSAVVQCKRGVMTVGYERILVH